MANSTSIEYVGSEVDEAVSALLRQVLPLGPLPTAGFVFLAGALARQAMELANALAAALPEVPCLIACSTAVLSDRRELDQVSALTGLFLRGGTCVPFGFDLREADLYSPVSRIARALKRTETRIHSLGLFVSKESFLDFSILDEIETLGIPSVFGGAAVGEPALVLIQSGKACSVDVAGLAFSGGARALVKASCACKVLGEANYITEIEEGVVIRIGDQPALSVLKNQARAASGRRLIVAAIALNPDCTGHQTFLVRPIRGIHETREGVVLGPDAPLGSRVAFATIDPAQSRLNLDTTLREMQRDLAGSTPEFGLYMDCTGRGSALYSASDVDIERIRSKFPKMPFAGMKSAFEIGPGDSVSRIHLYTGVLSVFRSPS